MKKLRFIINPNSGSGQGKKMIDLVNQYLDKARFEHEICVTEGPGHAVNLSREAAERAYDAVIVAGGDGSVNEAGTGLIHTDTALGVIPCGSGNGFARHFYLPLSAPAAIKNINTGVIRRIDTGSVNGKIFMATAGVGFDAEISLAFSKCGRRGLKNYVQVIMRKFPGYQSRDYQIITRETTFNQRAFLITFANTSQYGNNAIIAPKASAEDGLLDICVLRQFPKSATIGLLRRLFNKNIDRSKYMSTSNVQELRIHQNSELVHLDGDPCFLGKELEIKIHPLSLDVIIPKI